MNALLIIYLHLTRIIEFFYAVYLIDSHHEHVGIQSTD